MCLKESEVWQKVVSTKNKINVRLVTQGLPSSFLSRSVAYVHWRHEKLFGIVWTPIDYVILHLRDLRGAASIRHRNRAAKTVLVCERKPYPV